MQVDTPDVIRNLAIVGHNDTGKTTLVSALLYAGGAVDRMNRVEDGNTVTDFDPEEIQRGNSIGLAVCYSPWKKHKINLIDCPGYGIFFAESQSGMLAADAALLCVSGASGIEVMTERCWRQAEKIDLPVILHLTKMDRERADFDALVASLSETFAREAVPIQIPIGKESDFSGVVDLVTGQAYSYTQDGDGKAAPGEVPAELADTVQEWRGNLVEAVAESDDELMERYFEKGELTGEELERGLRRAIRKRLVFPITLSAASHGIGPSALLDTAVSLAPRPNGRPFPATNVGGEEIQLAADPGEPEAVLVFKTLSDPFSGRISLIRVASGTFGGDGSFWNPRLESAEKVGHPLTMQGKTSAATGSLVTGDIGGIAKLKSTVTGDTLCTKDRPVNVRWMKVPEPAMSFAIEPKAKGDEEKIGEALTRLMEEDITLRTGRDPDTHEFLLSGTGQRHAEIVVAKLKKRFNVEVILHPPKVPYRETIRRKAEGHGRHKKQTGGRGQFADCRIAIEPMPRGDDFEFVDEIFGGSIPQGYRPAVEKGIQEARVRGFLAGYRMVDFRVRLLDGQYHDVDSSEMAFKIAGSMAYKDAMEKAAPIVLEPMMSVEVTSDEEFTGDIIGDLSQRRGRPQGMETKGGSQVIKAVAPMAEMLDYAPALRAITQGRASFHMEYSHYEELPKQIQDKLVEEYRQSRDEAS